MIQNPYHYEECLMSSQLQAKKCLKLLKYFVLVNKAHFSVWSYFLKTLLMELILKNPHKGCWDLPLFSIFWQALANLYYFVDDEQCEEFCDLFVNGSVLLSPEYEDEHNHRKSVKKKKGSSLQNSHCFLRKTLQKMKHLVKHKQTNDLTDFVSILYLKL